MAIRSVFAPVSMTVALTTMVAFGEVIYENDFTTRTSKDTIPAYGVWQTAQPYPNKMAFFAHRPSAASGSYAAASLATYSSQDASEANNGRPYVDGWFIPYFNNNYKSVPRYYIPAAGNLAENPVFTWSYGSSNPQNGYILQSIHNEFTNGLLRIQVDMKAPLQWVRGKVNGANETVSTLKIFPVYRKYMDILAWNNNKCDTVASPGKFGLRSSGNVDDASCLRSFPQYWDSRNNNGSTTQLGNNDSGSYTDNGAFGKTNYWFRFIVTYDLDNNTFSGETYRFSTGKGHPSFDTAPSDASPNKTFSDATVMAPLTAETGGIAGIGFSCYGRFNGVNAANAGNKPFADNIRLSWKAPGAEDFEVFYENDFTTRRYRTLCASIRTTEAVYAVGTAIVDETDTFSGYTASTSTDSNRIVPNNLSDRTVVQPVGIDGWRRLPCAPNMHGNPAVVAYGGGGTYDPDGVGTNMLTFGNQSGLARIVQTLGLSITSGTVRIVADARLPKGDKLTTVLDGRRAAVGLGSAALYVSDRANLLSNLAGGVGYERLATSGEVGHRPYVIAVGGSESDPVRTYPGSYTEPDNEAWYRFEVAANLDAKTYSASITPIGATSVTVDHEAVEPPIYTAVDVSFVANVDDIGSFYLCGYGYGEASAGNTGDWNMEQRICWDNIRVYHGTNIVYENDFSTRTRTLAGVTRETGELAALQYNLDGGQDHWVRRDYTGDAGFDARAQVRDDNGNQFLSLGRVSESGRTILVANSLGASIARPFRCCADIRPPSQWSAASGFVKIVLGDSQMAQTEAPESVYAAHRLVSFGFDGTNMVNNVECPYYAKGCKAAVDGTMLDAAIDETHWYRFCVKADPESGTCDVRLYDMGTAHPTAETAGGTLVATATGIAFENALAVGEGVSTIHIAGDGLSGAVGSLGIDPAHALVDNLKLSDIPSFSISIR